MSRLHYTIKMSIAKIFAENLRGLRESKNLTQAQLSERLNYKSRTVVTNWESGRIVPDIENLIVLAKFFGVTIDYLVGIEG